MKRFTFAVKKGFFRTPSLPPRFEAKIASVCVVAALVVVANHFCYGPFTVFPQSHHNEPFMPADRTCSGGAYTFQIPGSLGGTGQRRDSNEYSERRFDRLPPLPPAIGRQYRPLGLPVLMLVLDQRIRPLVDERLAQRSWEHGGRCCVVDVSGHGLTRSACRD